MAVVLRQLVALLPATFLDARDPYGWHPLHIIANNPDANRIRPGMIRTLCLARCEIDPRKNHEMTPLMSAIATSHVAAADELVLQGANIQLKNKAGSTAYNQAWHNNTMTQWARQLGIQDGNPVTGEGRLFQ